MRPGTRSTFYGHDGEYDRTAARAMPSQASNPIVWSPAAAVTDAATTPASQAATTTTAPIAKKTAPLMPQTTTKWTPSAMAATASGGTIMYTSVMGLSSTRRGVPSAKLTGYQWSPVSEVATDATIDRLTALLRGARCGSPVGMNIITMGYNQVHRDTQGASTVLREAWLAGDVDRSIIEVERFASAGPVHLVVDCTWFHDPESARDRHVTL